MINLWKQQVIYNCVNEAFYFDICLCIYIDVLVKVLVYGCLCPCSAPGMKALPGILALAFSATSNPDINVTFGGGHTSTPLPYSSVRNPRAVSYVYLENLELFGNT